MEGQKDGAKEISNICSECGKSFTFYKNLRRHVRKFHPDKETLAPLKKPLKTYKFKCNLCPRQYNSKKNFLAHKRKQHEFAAIKTNRCGLCNGDVNQQEFTAHLKTNHNVDLQVKNLSFPCLRDFKKWKTSIEMEENVRFIKRCGDSKTADGKEVLRFFCHRSGSFIGRGLGLRKIKHQGSKKINSFCPANMKVHINKTGECDLKYIETHIGHENELCHITLTPEQREELAAKIALKIPLCEILNEVRDSVFSEKMGRMNILTRKDLINIVHTYNLKKVYSEENIDPFNVSSLSEKCETTAVQDLCEYDQNDMATNIVISQLQLEESRKRESEKLAFEQSEITTNIVISEFTLQDKKRALLEKVKLAIDSIMTEEEINVFDEGITALQASLKVFQENQNRLYGYNIDCLNN